MYYGSCGNRNITAAGHVASNNIGLISMSSESFSLSGLGRVERGNQPLPNHEHCTTASSSIPSHRDASQPECGSALRAYAPLYISYEHAVYSPLGCSPPALIMHDASHGSVNLFAVAVKVSSYNRPRNYQYGPK